MLNQAHHVFESKLVHIVGYMSLIVTLSGGGRKKKSYSGTIRLYNQKTFTKTTTTAEFVLAKHFKVKLNCLYIKSIRKSTLNNMLNKNTDTYLEVSVDVFFYMP